MAHETQSTISHWMDNTFPGADPESPRKALRALEEMVELCLAAGATRGEIRATVEHAANGVPVHDSRPDPDKVPNEAADVVIVLCGLAHQRGFNLHEAIDQKMQINRNRVWMANGDGTGYHVKQITTN